MPIIINVRTYNIDDRKKFQRTRVSLYNFGIIKEDSFEVEVDFLGFAARYVAERIWSQDQKIIDKEGDKVIRPDWLDTIHPKYTYS